MPKDATLNIRIDRSTKTQVERICAKFGITTSDAINIYLHKMIMVGGIPFDITLPHTDTARTNEHTANAQEAQPDSERIDALAGSLHHLADPELAARESTAWERHVMDTYDPT